MSLAIPQITADLALLFCLSHSAADARHATAVQVGKALREHGFFYATGHGINAAAWQAALQHAR
jgi:isopenicillin N synthase-like dioxygenase